MSVGRLETDCVVVDGGNLIEGNSEMSRLSLVDVIMKSMDAHRCLLVPRSILP